MATWDKGWNFRATAGYVTDSAPDTYDLGTVYPVTRNGVTFGWNTDRTLEGRDRATVGARFAGIHQVAPGAADFRIDLPQAGTYTVRLALGDIDNIQSTNYVQIADDTSALLTIDDTGGTANDEFDDATGVGRSSAAWPGSNLPADVTFTGTICRVRCIAGKSMYLAHIDFFAELADPYTWEQEGFRWRDDDGSETTASPLAAQDTPITRTTGVNTRVRVLVDSASADPPSTQMRLEYKEDSEAVGLWRAVGSGAMGAMPAYDGTGQAAAITNATITTPIAPAKPSTVNAGDLLILHVLTRNDNNNGAGPATITDWTAFAGNPYGGTNNSRQSLYWRLAGAGEASQTVSVTCTGGLTNDLVMARIYRFTAVNGFATTPIEDIQVNAGTASPLTAPATVTPTGINRRAVCFGAIASSDATIGNMTGETAGNWLEAVTGNSTIGGDGTLNVQTADASAGTAIEGGSIAFTLSTSAHWNTVACCLVPATVAPIAITMAASGNLTDGAATTVQLTAPAGKSTADFGGGSVQDTTVLAAAVDLALNEYGEWEWCLQAVNGVAAIDDVYQFRVTRAGTVLDTYTVTPTWTIGAAITTPEITVSDTVALADTLTLRGLILLSSVSEILTLAEAIQVQRTPLLRSVSDTLTLADSVTIRGLVLPVAATDSVSLAELVTPTGLLLPISLTDSLSLGELVLMPLAALQPIVAESLSLTESVSLQRYEDQDLHTVRVLLQPQPSELITLVDQSTVIRSAANLHQLAVSETLTLGDSVQAAEFPLQLTTLDTLTLLDQSTGSLSLRPAAADTLSLTDSVTAQRYAYEETVAVHVLLQPQPAEVITLADAPAVSRVTPGLREVFATESVTVAEQLTLQPLRIAPLVSDVVSLTDSVTAQRYVYEELVTLNVLLQPRPTELITLADLVSFPVAGTLSISRTETISLTDSASAELFAPIRDSIVVSEQVRVMALLQPRPQETVSLADSSTVIRQVAGVISLNVNDLISLVETPTLRGLLLTLSRTESVTVAETPTLRLLDQPRVTETVSLSDSTTVRLAVSILSSEVVNLTETPALRILRLFLSVTDVVQTLDQPQVVKFSQILDLSVTDTISLAEARQVLTTVPFVAVPVLRVEALLRDLSFTSEVLLMTTDVVLRDLSHVAGVAAGAVMVELRNLSLARDIMMETVEVPLRDLSQVA